MINQFGSRARHPKRIGLAYHSQLFGYDATFDQVCEHESVKLGFLRRKLLDGCKIYTVKRIPKPTEEEVLPLWAVLRHHSPNTLLFVVQAEPPYPPGTVESHIDGLIRGHIDRFAPL